MVKRMISRLSVLAVLIVFMAACSILLLSSGLRKSMSAPELGSFPTLPGESSCVFFS